MAIQRGIALSACPETTAGLTRSQGFQAGAQQRACVCRRAQPGKSDAWVRRRGCALWAGPAGSAATMDCEMPQARGPTDGQWQRRWRWRWRWAMGDLHYTAPAPAWEVAWPDASTTGGRGWACVCRALLGGGLASSKREKVLLQSDFSGRDDGNGQAGRGGAREGDLRWRAGPEPEQCAEMWWVAGVSQSRVNPETGRTSGSSPVPSAVAVCMTVLVEQVLVTS